MAMTPERWDFLSEYSQEVFGAEDEHLAGLMTEAVAAGMPDISVGADVGRLLKIITSMTRGQLAIEVGTLAGYSGIWITRGLRPEGRLITIESEAMHAD
ncbi:MAG TPA: methyltransferase, partial [Acidimicrobiia bacterium]|nr:methyltransferase [Acidimicrobiia bacterium]